jgi:hypothetical protein
MKCLNKSYFIILLFYYMNNNKIIKIINIINIINILIFFFTIIIIYYLYSIYFTIYEYHDVGNNSDKEIMKLKNKLNNFDLILNKDKEKYFKLEDDLLITNKMIKLNTTNITNSQEQFKKILTNKAEKIKNNPDTPVNDETINEVKNVNFDGLM